MRIYFLFLSALFYFNNAHSQDYASRGYQPIGSKSFSLPANTSGLTDPGFRLWAKLEKISIGEKYYLHVTFAAEHSTTHNPNPNFWYRYKTKTGKQYTDKEIGTEPFSKIKFYGADFNVKIMYGANNINRTFAFNNINNKIGEVPKDFNLASVGIFVGELARYNCDTGAIQSAIATYEANIQKKKQEEEKKKQEEEKRKNEERKREEEQRRNRESDNQTNNQEGVANNQNSSNGTRPGGGAATPVGGGQSRSNSTQTRTDDSDTYFSASHFKGGLNDLKEGEYFVDGKGGHFKKSGNGAVKVERGEYDAHIYRQQQKKIEEHNARDYPEFCVFEK